MTLPHRFSYRFLRLPVTEDWNLTWRPELDLTSSLGRSVSSRDRCRSCNAFRRRGECTERDHPVGVETHLSGAGGAAADPPRGPPEGRDRSPPDVGLRPGLRFLFAVVEGLPVALISANMRLELVIRALPFIKQLWPSG